MIHQVIYPLGKDPSSNRSFAQHANRQDNHLIVRSAGMIVCGGIWDDTMGD